MLLLLLRVVSCYHCSVVFVDEVDSMLGRRDKSGEHEAMRKIKNEFMSNWDGLKTNQSDRVLVLVGSPAWAVTGFRVTQ